jgi:hypothetical protein
MAKTPRKELKFQDHLIDSYRLVGGHAHKWASEWLIGVPDLVCCLPTIGVHLIEVKHIPILSLGQKNPMTAKQVYECKRYKDAGGLVFLAVVKGGPEARATQVALFDVSNEKLYDPLSGWHPYVPGKKYDVTRMAIKAVQQMES